MRISELRKIVREVVRNSVKESVFDNKGLERAGTGLPQTEEEPIEHPIEEGHSCGCNEVHDCGCGGHSVNEGKYYVTYNRGRGQGKGLEKEFDQKSFKTTDKPKVFSSYNDAKKYAEKMEKMFQHSIGGGTAYWVSDEKMNPIKESVNEALTGNEKRIKDGNPNNVYYAFYKGQFEAIYWAMNPSSLRDIYWDKFKVRRPAGSKFKLNPELIVISKKDYDNSPNHYSKLKPHVDKLWDKLQTESVNESAEPAIITQMRDIVKSGYKKLKDPKTGQTMMVDTYSASAIVKVYDALKQPKNKEQFASMGLMGMQKMAFKLIK